MIFLNMKYLRRLKLLKGLHFAQEQRQVSNKMLQEYRIETFFRLEGVYT
jgi:hypothetical protein